MYHSEMPTNVTQSADECTDLELSQIPNGTVLKARNLIAKISRKEAFELFPKDLFGNVSTPASNQRNKSHIWL